MQDEAAGRATFESVSASNVGGLLVHADVSQPEQLTRRVEEAAAHFGGLEYFVHSPSGRPTVPSDVGGAVAALCSDDACWITGQTIVADGGASLMNPEVPLDFQRP